MNVELFRDLVATPGISGREERIRDVVQKHMTDLVDDTRIDALGNLVGIRNGSGPRVMICAHMDSIGFLVTHIDDDGFLRISPVGGFDPRTLVMQRVVVCGEERDFVGLLSPATKPIHLLNSDEAKKPPKIEDLFIDLMLPADEVKAGVSIGDPVSLVRDPLVTDQAVT
ncbi:MAG TPA: M42 family peptidase, partial [Actinomycetota bacterium]|nr:M42 family peptidase [Actinomycetota bacterium]